eukprot:Ihof_evm2s161 gene=Ihof_evmTU2s161
MCPLKDFPDIFQLQGDVVEILSGGHQLAVDDGTGIVIVDLLWLTKATGENPISSI